jgi:transglutaminase-like putative cysteine protease
MTRSTRLLLFLLVFPSPALAVRGESKPALDPDQPYLAQKSNPVTYDVDFVIVVTAPAHTKVLKVWLPLPQTDAGQEVEEKSITTFPMTVAPRVAKEAVFGNKLAYFQFDHPAGAQLIRHQFKVKVWEMRWNIDPDKIVPVKKWPSSFTRFLRGDRTVVVNDRLRKIAREIVPQTHGAGADIAAAIAWVGGHIRYDHGNASLGASSEFALDHRCGHCSDFHGLCAAFGRGLGVPTRITYGINPFPKNSPTHCKVEAYLPPHGWVSFDVSETHNMIGKIQKNAELDAATKEKLVRAATSRLLHGFRDNTWYLQTRGTDYDLVPRASKRVPVIRTLYAEADGVALPDPDPANPKKKEFAWMTSHKYVADKAVKYPFEDWHDLLLH